MNENTPFGPHEEKAIISLAFDVPDFFSTAIQYLKPEHFKLPENEFVFSSIEKIYEKTESIPTRGIIKDLVLRVLTVDDEYDDILAAIDRKSDYREVQLIKEQLIEWAKNQEYGRLFNEEGYSAWKTRDYDYIDEVVESAKRITDINNEGFWLFENTEKLFQENLEEKHTTGFPALDRYLNDGGPTKKEVVVWMAPTGVGKCHTPESKIWEKKLSQIFELEIEDNGKVQTIKLAGFRKIQTTRGNVRICDLTKDDDIIKIPDIQDEGDLQL